MTKDQRVAKIPSILKEARERIADEKHWCKNSFALGWRGKACNEDSLFARQWCAMGSINKSFYRAGIDDKDRLDMKDDMARLWNEITGDYSIINFNDSHSHAEVISVLDKAINKLECR